MPVDTAMTVTQEETLTASQEVAMVDTIPHSMQLIPWDILHLTDEPEGSPHDRPAQQTSLQTTTSCPARGSTLGRCCVCT